MTPYEALEKVLKKEQASIRLYKELSQKHPGIKDLLFSLVNEEQKHKKMIQDKIKELKK